MLIINYNMSKNLNRNLFLIRQAALEKHIIGYIISKIKEKGYKIIDIILITVNSKEKFCESLYNNYNEFKKEILQANGKQCLVIITDLPEGNQPNVLKNEIRAKYAELYPASFGGVAGNIIHCSDSPEDYKKELSVLLDENKISIDLSLTHVRNQTFDYNLIKQYNKPT